MVLSYIGAIEIILVKWYLSKCHGTYIDAMLFILVPWYIYWCHVIYIGAMVFTLVPWYLYCTFELLYFCTFEHQFLLIMIN